MGRRHRRKKRRLLSRGERKVMIVALIICVFLGLFLAFATGKFPTLKEKATDSMLKQYIPKDMDREDMMKKAKEALGGKDEDDLMKKAQEYLKKGRR